MGGYISPYLIEFPLSVEEGEKSGNHYLNF